MGGVLKGSRAPAARVPTAKGPEATLLTAARKTGSSSPTGSPSASDRLQLQGTTASYTQKPKPSALAASRALRADRDALSPASSPTSSEGSGRRAASAAKGGKSKLAGDADAPLEHAEALSIDVGEAADGDDEPFVPEEEEEGPATQGDHLMMAKAKMRRQRSPGGLGSPCLGSPGVGGMGSPGLDSPNTNPVRRSPVALARCRVPPRAPSRVPSRASRPHSRTALTAGGLRPSPFRHRCRPLAVLARAGYSVRVSMMPWRGRGGIYRSPALRERRAPRA